jgi:hypothetical protein
MICEQCKTECKTSKVCPGVGATTLVYNPPFYDEHGKYHHHDSNVTTSTYTCSNGHEWSARSTGSCWCGWPNDQTDEKEGA